jgi:hypothetical protein
MCCLLVPLLLLISLPYCCLLGSYHLLSPHVMQLLLFTGNSTSAAVSWQLL